MVNQYPVLNFGGQSTSNVFIFERDIRNFKLDLCPESDLNVHLVV